jgi:two-component system, OmpR family, phosphate regulon sensor histidine kinase PhoR
MISNLKFETRNLKTTAGRKNNFRFPVSSLILCFMWFTFTLILLAVGVALHFWWRTKLRREQAVWRSEMLRREGLQEAAAAETRARQDALFDSMIEGVLVLDEKDAVRFANQTFAELFATSGILRGKALLDAVRLHEIAELVERTRSEGRVMDHELKLSGEPERWLQINAAALTGLDRRKLGTILVFHDLTRLKRLERTREEFVANVSHELRTPLSLIKGYVETLLDGAKNNPEVAERFLKIVERNTNRLDLLIQDLLTISSLESGRMKLELSAVNLRSLAAKVLGDLAAKAEAKKISLVNELPELIARGDGNRLDQVLANLVDNAIKYGGAHGRVVVGGKKLASGALEMLVRDDGPGIPLESLDRVFERFYRVDKARSRDQGGTGLGLAIVKHIVQAHGGEVWAASEPGKGATFFFTLPEA